jgi:DNA-binding NtrC family response regulator
MAGLRLLLVDDSETIRSSAGAYLRHEGYDVLEGSSCASAVEAAAAGQLDAAVIDYALPDGTALDLLPRLRDAGVPVIVLTGHASIELAVRAIKEGAEHFLTKPVELATLTVVLRRVIETRRALRKQLAVRSVQDRAAADPFLGESAAIRKLKEEARMVLASESPILIHGETGSGKGLLASWLHANGPRAEEAFVDLNCAGLSPQFLETELFGHERGAFTGAVASKVGLFDVANRGTLFLDEIGDVDPVVQPKLLKVVEERRFRRLGDVRDRAVDVRLVAATHQDLQRLVRERRFRGDLYFRISALPLEVPPLRARPEDVPIIAARLLERIGADLGRPHLRLAAGAEAALKAWSWPGNVRELRNVLERGALLASGDEIRREELRFTNGSEPASDGFAVVSLRENERRYLEKVLRSTGGRVEDAAKALGVPRSSLYEKLKRHGLGRGHSTHH